jgi:HK97 family phage portal protein
MKILNNLKTLFTQDLSAKAGGDITLPLSRMASLWDAGKTLITAKGAQRPGKPYAQVDTVWICVNLIINLALSIQLVLSTQDDDIIESGPAYDFLFNNQELKYRDFVIQTLGFYLLFREVYWIYEDKNLLKPTQIRVVGPRQIEPVIDRATGDLVAYKFFRGPKVAILDIDDVHCVKNFNPDNPHRGLGPIDAGSLTISTAYQASLYLESSLANGARLATILSNKTPGLKLDETEITRLRRQFKRTQGGAANAAEVFYAQDIEVDTISQTMADLQMVDQSQATDNKICALFGVPPECVGLNTEAQYAQGPATQRLILFGVAPVLMDLAEAIDDGILDKYRFTAAKNKTAPYRLSKCFCGHRLPLYKKAFFCKRKLAAIQSGKEVFAWYDVESHEAIQSMALDKIEKALKLVAAKVPLNQIVAAYNLPFDETKMPHGDFAWGTAGELPLQWILDAGMDAVLGPDLPEGTDGEPEPDKNATTQAVRNKDIEEKSTRIWRKYAASWQPLEREMTEAVRQFLRRQKNGVLKRLTAAIDKTATAPAVRTKAAADDLIMRVMFDLKVENNQLLAIHRTFYERGQKFGAVQVIRETTGASADEAVASAARAARTQAARRSLTISAHKIRNVNATTQQWLQETLSEGLKNGEGLSELSRRISSDPAFSAGRAKNIARTSTSGAVSGGRFEGLKTVSDRKGWLSARNESVRSSHKEADSRYSTEGIPVNEKFIVGGSALMYPADPEGDVGEIVNCRCMLIAVKAGGKTITLDDYDNVNFLPYTEFKTLLNEAHHGLD